MAEEEAEEKINKKPSNKRKKIKIVLWSILALIVILAAVEIINAAKYKMVVNVVAGENILGVNPTEEKLDFGDLSRNNGMTRYINLKNGGKTSTYMMVVKYGEISSLVTLNENYFTLKPGEEFKLAFEINIPPSAEIKKYSGGVWIFRLPKVF